MLGGCVECSLIQEARLANRLVRQVVMQPGLQLGIPDSIRHPADYACIRRLVPQLVIKLQITHQAVTQMARHTARRTVTKSLVAHASYTHKVYRRAAPHQLSSTNSSYGHNFSSFRRKRDGWQCVHLELSVHILLILDPLMALPERNDAPPSLCRVPASRKHSVLVCHFLT